MTVQESTPADSRQSSYSRDELLRCGHGELFGPGNAQLPLPPMLMFDRITMITSEGGLFDKGQMTAELDISPDLWFFNCHFQNDPVMLVWWGTEVECASSIARLARAFAAGQVDQGQPGVHRRLHHRHG